MTQAEQYFQVAAANVRNAILERQNLISQKKAEIAQKEQEFNKQREELKKEARTKGVAAGQKDLQESTRGRLLREALEDERAVTEAEKQFNDERDQLQKEITALEQDFDRINRVLKELDLRALS